LDAHGVVNQFDYEPGLRGTLSFMVNRCSTLEASFTQIEEWSAHRHVKGDGDLSFPFDSDDYTHDYFSADEARAKYKSKYYSGEANYWRHVTPRRENYFSVSWLGGLRYMNIWESFVLAYTRGADTSDYDIRSQNKLYGVQLGGNLQMNPSRCLSWDFLAKVGVCLNRAWLKTSLRDENNTLVLRDFEADRRRSTFFTEVFAMVTYQMFTHLNFHGGYQMLFLSGLVLAPEHADHGIHEHSGERFRINGNAILHGFYGGISLGF
jgi:hypothetical protein